MAQLLSEKNKPPMFILEYWEKKDISEEQANDEVSTNETDIINGLFENVKTKFINTATQPLNNVTRKYGLPSLQLFGKQPTEIKKIKTLDLNSATMDWASSRSKKGSPKMDSKTAIEWAKPPRTGWAVVRHKSLGNSVLAPDDDRVHLLTANEVAAAPIDFGGVVWVYQAQGGETPIWVPGSPDYYNHYVERFEKGRVAKTLRNYEYISEPGDNKYKVVILDQSALNLPSYPPANVPYVVIRYYKDWEYKPGDRELPHPIQTDINGLNIDVFGLHINFPWKDEEDTTTTPTYDIWMLDFHDIARRDFGFGVERFDFGGDSRKSIQQTRGKVTNDTVQNNFYVDTWWKGPETITLAGVIELPNGYETNVLIKYSESYDDIFSPFLEATERFFLWNNNPIRANRGDYMIFRDLYREQEYKVTFKSRRYSQSVERQSLVSFQFDFVVLDSTKDRGR